MREAILNFARRSTGRISRPHAYPDQPDVETLATGLFDTAALLGVDPERAEAMRREGTACLAERYSDDKRIACLDHSFSIAK